MDTPAVWLLQVLPSLPGWHAAIQYLHCKRLHLKLGFRVGDDETCILKEPGHSGEVEGGRGVQV